DSAERGGGRPQERRGQGNRDGQERRGAPPRAARREARPEAEAQGRRVQVRECAPGRLYRVGGEAVFELPVRRVHAGDSQGGRDLDGDRLDDQAGEVRGRFGVWCSPARSAQQIASVSWGVVRQGVKEWSFSPRRGG